MNTSFNDIKKNYEASRNEQRNILVKYLSKKLNGDDNYKTLNIINSGNAGKGKKTYNNANTIAPFNLNNWKWVEVQAEGFSCIISLNMIDLDKNTANFHALYDRIGLIVYYKKGSNSYNNFICTSIDLPFDENKLKIIYELVIEQYNLCKN